MTYVVVELCVDCKYTDCAAVCPVEAFHELTDRLYINADTCIDCDACVPNVRSKRSSPTRTSRKIMRIGRRSTSTKRRTTQSSARRFRRCMDQPARDQKRLTEPQQRPT